MALLHQCGASLSLGWPTSPSFHLSIRASVNQFTCPAELSHSSVHSSISLLIHLFHIQRQSSTYIYILINVTIQPFIISSQSSIIQSFFSLSIYQSFNHISLLPFMHVLICPFMQPTIQMPFNPYSSSSSHQSIPHSFCLSIHL